MIQEILDLHPGIMKMLEEVAKFEKHEFHSFSFSEVQYKGRRDLVSYVDIEAEHLLKKKCVELIPESGFITEESHNINSKNGFTWIIDPVDGTTNYTHGIPFFSISLALQYKEEILAGYVYDVMNDSAFYAQKGKGAKLNDQALSVSNIDTPKESLIATGFPYDKISWRENYWKMLGEVLDKTHGVRRIGSAALELSYVAAGRLDGYFEFGLKPWDVAAGTLILREAGGKASNINGFPDVLYSGQMIASNGHIHNTLLSMIKLWAPM